MNNSLHEYSGKDSQKKKFQGEKSDFNGKESYIG